MRVIFRNSKLRTLVVVVACVLAGLLVREGLGPILEERAPYMFFLFGCLAAAWYAGAPAGFVVLLVGGALSQALFVHQYGPWYPVSLKEWAFFATYATASTLGILVVVSLRRAFSCAEQATLLAQRRAEELRQGMRERTDAEARWRELAAVVQVSEQQLRTQNEQLAASRQALESERSRYRELFDSAPVGYIISNPQGVIEQANLAAARLLNESPQFLTGFPMARLLAKKDQVTFFAHIGRLTREEVQKVENWEVVLQPHLRVPFPCAITVNLVRDEGGKPAGLRWLMRDISERKQAEQRVLRLNMELEQRVRDRTAELQKANQELETFSYSVSHDLRAPLRSIAGFSKAVLEEYRDKLDVQGVTYLQYAVDASKRMSQLIEDLLAFSRYTRCEMRRQNVDLSALAESALDDLRQSEPNRDVKVKIAPGINIRGDESLLRIALQNLLNNAWKFTGKKPHPEIEFGLAEKNGSNTYFVKDNGAGFSMEHAQRLFGVFQRLHSTEEFPGTGVGLATVRRIFHRHGGEIWAESEVGKGATFFFTLPGEPR